MDASQVLAGFVVETRYEDLSTEVVDAAKRVILDGLGVLIPGSEAPGCAPVLALFRHWGGREEATVGVHGYRMPAPNAASMNSMMCHALDLDDVHELSAVHADTTTLFSVLALAEAIGGISGKDLITSLVLGVEVGCRIGLASKGPPSWQPGAVCGGFGAAAAVGKILGLDEEQMVHALGITLSQTAGTIQSNLDAALVKRMQPANSARAAITAGLLAKEGLTGPRNSLEGPYGFFQVYNRGLYDRDELTRDLGKTFEVTNLSIRLYPCCRLTNASVDTALAIVKETDLKPEDVEEVIVYATPYMMTLVGRPFEIRGGSAQVSAQYSIPYTVALAIVEREVFVGQMSEEAIRSNEKVLQLAKRVRPVWARTLKEGEIPQIEPVPVTLEIRTKGGSTIRKTTEVIKGSPQDPLSMEDCVAKFWKCSNFAARPLSRDKLQRLVDAVIDLEHLDDAGTLMSLLT